MRLIIEIPDEKYEWIKKNNQNADVNSIVGAVANGKPLPKGHGRLIDADAVIDNGMNKGFCNWYDEIENAPTIIEADKEAEND